MFETLLKESYVKFRVAAVVFRTNVRLSAEGAHGDGVVIERHKVVWEGAVHVANAVKFGRDHAGEEGNEEGASERINEVLAAVELRHNHVLSVKNSRQRQVQTTGDLQMRVMRQVALKANEQRVLDVERRWEWSERVRPHIGNDFEKFRRYFVWKMSKFWAIFYFVFFN